jgi:uncharacterized protein YdhG (YjbR/CyaY superfamily)
VYTKTTDMDKHIDVDSYIATFPDDVQQKLQQLRKTVLATAPQARETIGYGMPTFILEGNLIHFAAFKNHIGLYPGPSVIEAFKNALSGYKLSKGTVQFPLDQPLPLETIVGIVRLGIENNMAKAAKKKMDKKLAPK